MYLVKHPDGYIKVKNGSEYLDIEANFALDYGSVFPMPTVWDAKYTGLLWEPSRGGLFGFNSETRDFISDTWPDGDLILTAIDNLITAKGSRENPPLTVNQKRDLLKLAIANEGLARIQAALPAIDTFQEIAFAATFWNMWGTPNTQQILARDTYVYAETKKSETDTWNEATIDAYNPATDPNWPV